MAASPADASAEQRTLDGSLDAPAETQLDGNVQQGPDAEDATDAASDRDVRAMLPSLRLEANDVSILWPIAPDPLDGRFPPGYLKLLPVSGERGPGLPAEAMAFFAEARFHADVPREVVNRSVVVSALRVDPCAPRAVGACVPELRISVQPFLRGLDDAAAHLVYELSRAAFDDLRSDLRLLKRESPVPTSGSLAVHPGLLAAGMSSSYARLVGDIVVRHARADRLTRVTINFFSNDSWSFSGVERVSGWMPMAIPLIGGFSQGWGRGAMPGDLNDPNGVISPAPENNFGALLAQGGVTFADPRYRPTLELLGRFRHPSQFTTANSDCVSCHLAPQAALFYEARGASLGTLGTYVPPAGFDASIAVDPSIRGNLSVTIMFGWHRSGRNDGPGVYSIAQRVSHETAEVLQAMGEL